MAKPNYPIYRAMDTMQPPKHNELLLMLCIPCPCKLIPAQADVLFSERNKNMNNREHIRAVLLSPHHNNDNNQRYICYTSSVFWSLFVGSPVLLALSVHNNVRQTTPAVPLDCHTERAHIQWIKQEEQKRIVCLFPIRCPRHRFFSILALTTSHNKHRRSKIHFFCCYYHALVVSSVASFMHTSMYLRCVCVVYVLCMRLHV